MSVEAFYLLHIKLDNIDQAKELLEQLDSIHYSYCFPEESSESEDIAKQTNLLKKITTNFIEKYNNAMK